MPCRTGNAADLDATNGWLVGAFAGAPVHAEAVEVKWGRHFAGETRVAMSTDARPTLLILVSGRFRLDLADGSIELAEPGDWVQWDGEPHGWEAVEASVCVTVRWTAATV